MEGSAKALEVSEAFVRSDVYAVENDSSIIAGLKTLPSIEGTPHHKMMGAAQARKQLHPMYGCSEGM
jgi:hypothetical protein